MSLRTAAAAVALVALVTTAPASADPGRAEARVATAAKIYEAIHARLAVGAVPVDSVCAWSVRWLDAQREQPLKGKALAAAAQAHLERMTALEAEVTKAVAAGTMAAVDREIAGYCRLEAELWVERKGKR